MIKKTFISIGFFLLLFSFTISAQNKIYVNSENSIIHWKGFKLTGNHYGTIKIKKGFFTLTNNKITGGEFIIDMNSIVNVDIPADDKNNKKIVDHLKAEDFFNVENYPTAFFKITSTEIKENKILIKGNLTLKNKTNPVEFLAIVKIEQNQLIFKSDTFKIDRSKWNIQYKSKSFFNNLADKFIHDDMEISISIETQK